MELYLQPAVWKRGGTGTGKKSASQQQHSELSAVTVEWIQAKKLRGLLTGKFFVQCKITNGISAKESRRKQNMFKQLFMPDFCFGLFSVAVATKV